MNKDKKILYATSLLTFAVLLIILALTSSNSSIITAVAMAIIAPFLCIIIRKRIAVSINKKEALLLTTVIAALYVILILIAGMFVTSYKNPYFVTFDRAITQLLPLTVIIIASEAIRHVFLCQKNTFVTIVSWLICVLAEVLMFSGIAEFESFNHFMDLVGLTLFPAISANIFYHYASKQFGVFPNLSFRLICTLYIYFIPTYSEIPKALHSCIKILLPLILYALTKSLFERKKKKALSRGNKISAIGLVLAIAVVISTAMVISCQFRFGAIVIATESMTGEINKGDMIIYEEYKNQKIEEGQVIVFLQNESRIIHRVISIETVGGETRYYTKGDANNDPDPGYRTKADIVGLTDMKIAYAGYPTLWLRELLDSSN